MRLLHLYKIKDEQILAELGVEVYSIEIIPAPAADTKVDIGLMQSII